MARRRPRYDATPQDLERYGIDLNRYVVSMARSRKVLQRYREERREMVRQDVGAHYSDDGARAKNPLNLIGLYEQIVSTSLMGSNPQFLLSTFQPGMKAAVDAMQVWVNKQTKRMGLQETLQRIVTDALYSIGIAKVALASPTDAATLAWGINAGEPLVSPIDLDDWVYDTQANRFEEVTFMAHRYRTPLDAVKDSKVYDAKISKKLEPTQQARYNQEGDERISQIGKGLWWHQDDAEDMIDLWELYLPRHRLVVTLAHDLFMGAALLDGEGSGEPLRVQRWIGPERGPYHILGYKTVAGNAMPKGPISSLIDLHETANRTFRKLTEQADRQKTNVWYRHNEGDARRVKDSKDGEMIPVDAPDQVKETRLGGADQQNLQFFQFTQQLFSWAGGNLDILGGLSPQAKTLGQDKLLNANSSRVVSGMQDRTLDYTAGVGNALCWYWWNHPYLTMDAPYAQPGLEDLQVARKVYPADDQKRQQGQLTRHGPWDAIDLQVDPFSLQHQSPQERMAALNQTVTQVIIPMMPLLQSSGTSFDLPGYLKLMAKYGNMPELQDIVSIGSPVPDEQSSPDQPRMPQQTERKYVRENRSERTMQGTMQNLLTSGAGVNPGGSQQK